VGKVSICPSGWSLRIDYLTAPRDDEIAWYDWTYHLRTCGRCIEYVRAMTDRARDAVHPELTSEEMEAI
jgi:hypothetical protein